MEKTKNKIYSHSKLSTFEQCQLRFKYRYIDKIIPEIEKSIEAHLGTAIHSTLEWIYAQVQEGNIPTLDETLIYYSEEWQREFSSEVKIVNKELTHKDYFNKGIQFLIQYYTKHHPFEDGTIGLEKRVNVFLDEHGNYKIIGFIDRLVQNLQTGEYEIHDYKTANNLPKQEDIDNDRQLALYAIAIKQLFGEDKEVNLIWHYLAHNKEITSKRTNEQLQQLKKETIELIKKIESTIEFHPNIGRLCDWCEYKGMCHAHNPNQPGIKESKIQIDKEKYPTISKYLKD